MTSIEHRSLRPLELPAGPSAWSHRVPEIVLALTGAVIAGYLALVQAGAIATAWDPVFGAGSERVLTSPVATLLPVPDAALGMLAYLLEALLIALGGEDRWHAHRSLVIAMGLLVGALALGALGLLAIQAFVLHAGCTLCIASAVISLVLAALATPEVLAGIDRGRAAHAPEARHPTSSKEA